MSILTTCLHQYIGVTGPAAPIGKETLTFKKFKNFADFLNVSSTTPIQLNIAYSISWSERKRKYNYSKIATNFRDKRTSFTTVQAKNQAFAIFPPLFISHYPLPLMSVGNSDVYQFIESYFEKTYSFLVVIIKYCTVGRYYTA
jgi:hypothetical protein